MEQVKVFSHGFTDKPNFLEAEANDWLKENKNEVEIISRQSHLVTGINAVGAHYLNLTIVFFYRTK